MARGGGAADSGRGRSRLSEGREARLEEGRGGGGGAPIPIPPGSIERKRAPPVGSVDTKRKEMVRGNGEGEGPPPRLPAAAMDLI